MTSTRATYLVRSITLLRQLLSQDQACRLCEPVLLKNAVGLLLCAPWTIACDSQLAGNSRCMRPSCLRPHNLQQACFSKTKRAHILQCLAPLLSIWRRPPYPVPPTGEVQTAPPKSRRNRLKSARKRSFLVRVQTVCTTPRHTAEALPEAQDRNLADPKPRPNRFWVAGLDCRCR